MPMLHFMHTLSGQPDKEVGCEMFEESESILNERGKLCYCVQENGSFKVYKAPLVDTTDIRASRFRVMRNSQEYAVSKGDYADGSWVTVLDRGNGNDIVHLSADPLKRSGGSAAGYNVRVTIHGENAGFAVFDGSVKANKYQLASVHLPNSWLSAKQYTEVRSCYVSKGTFLVSYARPWNGFIDSIKVEVLQ